MIKKTKNNYIDNKQLFAAMVEYKTAVNEYKRQKELYGTPNIDKPKVTNYIGQCLLLIADNLGTKPNFSSYSYLGEMKSDGIENCLKYIDNFDPEKSKNPFAYFTTIIYYAFLRRIATEKKEQYVKYKNLELFLISNQLANFSSNDSSFIDNDITNNIIKNYEEFIERKKIAQKETVKKMAESKLKDG
jgi:hypothetical protein